MSSGGTSLASKRCAPAKAETQVQSADIRIVDDPVDHIQTDARISEILKGQDMFRLRRLLKEQFCYILDAGCDYTGRTMQASHKDMGIQTADVNALIEDLPAATRHEHI
jgi:hemoglobin